MQVQDIVHLAEGTIVLFAALAVLAGKFIGLQLSDVRRALAISAGIGVLMGVVLLTASRGTAARIGPIITREALLLSIALFIALLGGCVAGILKRQQRETGRRTAVLPILSLVVSFLVVGTLVPFFLRIQEVMDIAGSLGLLHARQAYEPKRDKACPENLHSLYKAFQQYAQDWDALPPAAGWGRNEELISKVKRDEWLHCPAVSNRHDANYGYAYNEAVSTISLKGKRLDAFPDASHTPLLYDSTDLSKSAHDRFLSLPRPGRHAGKNNVLYLDGHVESASPQQAPKPQ